MKQTRLLYVWKLLRLFGTYFFSSALSKALPFFLLPILTRFLSPAEYGLLALYQIVVSFFIPIVGMSTEINISTSFFSVSQKELGRLIYGLFAVLTINLGVVVVLLVILNSTMNAFGLPWTWLLVAAGTAFFVAVINLYLTLLRNQNAAQKYAAAELSRSLLETGLTVLLVVVWALSWQGRAISILVATMLVGFYGVYRLWTSGYIIVNADASLIKQIYALSLPLIVYALGATVLNLSDRFFLQKMIGLETVGIYAVGYQIGMGILLITDTFNKVWTPWVFKQLASIDAKKKILIVRFTYLYNVLILGLAFFITLVAPYAVKYFAASEYSDAASVVSWVAFAYAFRGMYTMIFPYLAHMRRTSFLAYVNVFGAGLNLAGNYFLIKQNGMIGAAQATVISYAIFFVSVWWYSQRIYPMPWIEALELRAKRQVQLL